MKTYSVIWEIQLDAKSPKDAAKEALKIMQDPTGSATVFTVYQEEETTDDAVYRVDLTKDEITEL